MERRHRLARIPLPARGPWRTPRPKIRACPCDHTTASRNGEPFDALIRKADILPNAVTRKCTAELKVSTIERYVRRDLGWKLPDVRNVIGLRYDERPRWEDALMTGCRTEYPMVHARVTHRDIAAFWARHPFDLAIHSALGNCDACFMKARHKLVSILRDSPEITDWWIDAEEQAVARRKDVLRRPEMARFSKRWTYRQLRDEALSTPHLPDFDIPVDTALPCFCTD